MGQAAGAKIELERLIASMQDARTPIPAEIMAEQSGLAGLISQIATASPADLPSLKRATATAIAAAVHAAQQAQASSTPQPGAALADALDASRRSVQSALEYTRTLDLHFASGEDERAYRQREADRRAYIEAEQAKGTPEGSLNAAGATVGQMADAKAHGAQGPEFDRRWDDLVATTERLRASAKANGVSTEEFDRRLRDDLRRILKSKGLSDAQIDATFAANPNPLDAMKAYVQGDSVGAVERMIGQVDTSAKGTFLVEADPVAAVRPKMSDAIAVLRNAGVTQDATAPSASEGPVSPQVMAGKAPPSRSGGIT